MGRKAMDGGRKLIAFSELEKLRNKLAPYLALDPGDLRFLEEQARVDQSQGVIIPVWESEVRPLGYLRIFVPSSTVSSVLFCGTTGTFRETQDGWEPLPTY